MVKAGIYLITILFILFSCNKENNQAAIKSKKELERCAHAEDKEFLSPPPIKNRLISSSKLKINQEKKVYCMTIDLTADENVDFKGEYQQTYRIQTKEDARRNMLFALPIEYNKYWNNLILTSNANNDSIFIEIKLKDKSLKLYKIYNHKYFNKKFGGGEIIIQAINCNNHKTI